MCARVVVWCGDFFFFKQKTAYEMRISDWSSDVCSSDLQRDRPAGDRLQPVDHLRLAVRQIVEADDLVPRRRQGDRDMAADIAGAAGQKNFQIRTFAMFKAVRRLAALAGPAKRAIRGSDAFPAFEPASGGACPAAAPFPKC